PIPYPRNTDAQVTYFKHLGIYAFRKQALIDFYNLPMLSLESAEKIEAIRFLEYGKNIKMVETQMQTIGIDTPEDLDKARDIWNN
ncbi:MAG: 3-deoxy-manno-octulosonate cytidylyltransferase, partial [Salegentibacter mishustinae]|nr:3-deoxy-manno-octulosonate cytidylyltransferase [Salegentibacter mishustinae]